MTHPASFLQLLLFLISASLLEARDPRQLQSGLYPTYNSPLAPRQWGWGQQPIGSTWDRQPESWDHCGRLMSAFLVTCPSNLMCKEFTITPDHDYVCPETYTMQVMGHNNAWTNVLRVRCLSNVERRSGKALTAYVRNGETIRDNVFSARCILEAEKKCTATSPLKSVCKTDKRFCEKVKFQNDDEIVCTEKMFASVNNANVEISKLSCNKFFGVWKGFRKDNESEFIVETGSNVYCHFDDCDISKFSPDCGSDSNCIKYNYTAHTFSCPSPATLWTRVTGLDALIAGTNEWSEFAGAEKFTCSRGKLHDKRQPLPEGTQVRCITVTAEPEPSIIGYIVGGLLTAVFVMIGFCLGWHCPGMRGNY